MVVEKPPYRVPSMAEILAIPWNGYVVVSSFSGGGGSCLGYRMAGYRVRWASEFIPAARETYKANHPDSILDERDIREVSPQEVLEAIGMEKGQVDLFDGSPPCASFSTAGSREKGWNQVKRYSDTQQRTDDLFFEYVRILRGLQPKTFVAENVSGLVKGKAKGYFKLILKAMKEAGYRVSARLLDAKHLGVPQSRQRLIFVGVREDLCERYGVQPVHPKPLPYVYTVRDALPHIAALGTAKGAVSAEGPSTPTVQTHGKRKTQSELTAVEKVPVRVIHDTSGERGQGDVTDRPCPAITVGVDGLNSRHYQVEEARIVGHSKGRRGVDQGVDEPAPTVQAHGMGDKKHYQIGLSEADISRFAIGREWDRLGPGEQSERYFNLVKPHPDRPSPTVTQTGGNVGAASVTHPTERRKFTMAELRRICAFPDDFVLTGTYAQQWERLGRSVPPVMMEHVARTVREEILDRLPEGA